jgi:hypothetical protein
LYQEIPCYTDLKNETLRKYYLVFILISEATVVFDGMVKTKMCIPVNDTMQQIPILRY